MFPAQAQIEQGPVSHTICELKIAFALILFPLTVKFGYNFTNHIIRQLSCYAQNFEQIGLLIFMQD